MRLHTNLIELLAYAIARDLFKHIHLSGSQEAAIEVVHHAIDEDMRVEDRLDEEVREILDQNSEQMRQTGAQYHQVFKMIKQKLVRERNLIL